MGKFCPPDIRGNEAYIEIAQRIISRNFKQHINNPDIIDEAIKAIFNADKKFDGRGNIMGFRSQQVKRAVQWRLSLNKRTQEKVQSYTELDLAYEMPEPCEIFEAAQNKLSPEEYKVIEMRFKLGMNPREISDMLSIRMNDSIIKVIISKLRARLKKEDFI